MIIYGSRAKQLAKETLAEKCPNCGSYSVDLYVFQKYAHVFWIPFFPMGKIAVAQCTSCKKAWNKNEFSETAKYAYQNLKAQTKTPVWTYAGISIVAIIIALTFFNEQKKNERNNKLILAPQAGDIFSVKSKKDSYTLYKVTTVRGDTVLLRMNEYETNQESGLSDLKRKGENGFSEVMLPYTKAELKAMFDKGEIIDIERE